MRNRKGYTRGEFTLASGSEVEAHQCDQYPHLGVCDGSDAGWYYVLHLPSGMLAAVVEGQDAALKLIERLGERVPGLACDTPPAGAKEEAFVIIQSFTNQKKVEKAAPPPEAGLVLEPIYNPGVTPSAAVRAADRQLASLLGQAMGGQEVSPDALTEARVYAIAVGWKEALLAAVDQVLANPDEYPDAPIRLADGTLCTWDGFRASYKRLIIIGNELQYRAIMLLEQVDLGTPPRQWFRDWEADWVTLITEGWQEWTACVSHFLASPPVRQEQVRQKLGYIGSRERGWGALGRKTFLRHPEIAEASKARRLVRYEREAKRGE